MELEEQVERFKELSRDKQLFTVFIALGNFFKSPVGLSLDEGMDRECIVVLRDKELLMAIKSLIEMATITPTVPEV